jgi:lipopolysaccharide export system ATP-binding protein
LILLDEPFTGIDPQTITDIQQIIRGLRQQGIGILITDHRVREILNVTDRSYLIKGGKVIVHGTPQEIVNNPVAISEYLGNSFAEDNFGRPGVSAAAAPPCEPVPPEAAIHRVVEQEKVLRLIERLRASDAAVASAELVQRGPAAVPALLDALERRDVEMRRQALEVLQQILGGAAVFDPYAPEAQRRQQLAMLRERTARKAG